MRPRVICILGMHRSGTSWLTGSLEEAGVFLGPVSRRNVHNLKGNCENAKIVALHEDLLLTSGGSWDSPPGKVTWLERHKAVRDEILREYEQRTCWGFKDPRTLLTLGGWLESLPDLAFVGIFRHPLPVAQSLLARNGLTLERSLDLWVRYNRLLLSYHEDHRFPILSFDLGEPALRRTFSELVRRLDLPGDGERATFFDPALRKAEAAVWPLPGHVADLYERLKALVFAGS